MRVDRQDMIVTGSLRSVTVGRRSVRENVGTFAKGAAMRHHLLLLLVCVCIGLAAAQPMLVTGRLPKASDSLFHLHRLVEVDALLRQGIVYSRWAPDLASGFGYPLFNYYAPLSYYLPEALHLLGLPFVAALLAGFVLALICSAVAMYAWAREPLGEGAAVVAAAAYVFSPYAMLNLIARAVLAEVFAMPLLPLTMFSLSRLLTRGRLRYAALLTLSLAMLMLSHNVSAALFSPVVGIYAVAWQLVGQCGGRATGKGQRAVPATRLLWALCAALAALCLTAFFWLPALAETRLVQIERLTSLSFFDYRISLVGLERIFAPPVLDDPELLNRVMPISLSLVAGLLAVVGILGLWRWAPSRSEVAQVGAAGLAVCLTVFMVTPASTAVWAAIPQMRLLQFAWRFLGVASPFLAFLAGAGLRAIEGRARKQGALRGVLVAVLVCVLFVWVFPWQDTSSFHPPLAELTIDDVVSYERGATLDIGTTTTGEYLPVTVHEFPPPEVATADYDRARLDWHSLPEGARVERADYRPLEYRLAIWTPRSFVAVFNTLDFPGWRVWVDGVVTEITPTDPYGLISVPVPAGRHVLRVSFGSTPVRTWAETISLVGVVVLVVGTVALHLWRAGACRKQVGRLPLALCTDTEPSTNMPGPAPQARGLPERLTTFQALVTISLLGIAFAFKSLYVDPHWVGHYRANLAIVSGANFGNRLILIGADRPPAAISGRQATIVMYWRVPAKTDAEYSAAAHLVDGQGNVLAEADNQHPGDRPTRWWEVTNYVRDPHVFTLPAGTPPGRYAVHAAVYPYGKPDQTLDVLDANGAPAGRSVVLTTLEVVRPPRPPREEELPMLVRLDRPLGADLTLLGCDLAVHQVRTGDRLPLVLYWKAETTVGPAVTVQLQLLDAAGAVAYSQDVPPVPGYDTGQWRRGDIWRGSQVLTIPARLPGGVYTLAVSRAGGPAAALGQVDVQAPAHQFTAPRLTYAQQATFGNLASLVGYDWAGDLRPDGEVTVTLVWRAEREDAGAYKTFVHLLRPDGSLLAGSDAVPGNWERPTSSWVAGEYIADPHRLRLPGDVEPGVYRLEVGLYDSSTLKRLQLGNGADALLLSQALEVRQ